MPPSASLVVTFGIPLVALAVGAALVLGARLAGANARVVAAILVGWSFAATILIAGRRLSQRRSHTFCLVAACLACLFMPFGTILGVFTLLVLLKPGVKQRFT